MNQDSVLDFAVVERCSAWDFANDYCSAFAIAAYDLASDFAGSFDLRSDSFAYAA